jgi:deoxyguanosine kinase
MKYIVIEGIIGAGKTTLATAVAKQTGSKLVLEEFAENPYLAGFYEDPGQKAFHVEMSFLAARTAQLKKEFGTDNALVADYDIRKMLLFASLTLSETEMAIFRHFYDQVTLTIRKPDLFIFVDTPPGQALLNIRKRGRSYETKISIEYLEKLYDKYQQMLELIPKDRLVVIPDPVSGSLDHSKLTDLIFFDDINNSL